MCQDRGRYLAVAGIPQEGKMKVSAVLKVEVEYHEAGSAI